MNHTLAFHQWVYGITLCSICFLAWVSPVEILAAQEPGQTPLPNVRDRVPEPRPEIESVLLDHDYEDFAFIEDDGPFLARGNKIPDPVKDMAAFRESKAYDYVLAHASRQTPELLQKYSEKNVPYANLFRPIRTDYLRELLHFEGRLSLVLPMKATDGLKKFENIDKIYQVWIYPTGHSDPLCLVVTELPEGVVEGEDQNLRVEFDAYFFKLFHYESRQDKQGDSGKKQWRKAPLFLGKTFRTKAAVQPEPLYTDHMLLWIVSFLSILALVITSLGYWYKRNGRYVEVEKRRRLEQSGKYLEEF